MNGIQHESGKSMVESPELVTAILVPLRSDSLKPGGPPAKLGGASIRSDTPVLGMLCATYDRITSVICRLQEFKESTVV